MMCIYLEYLLLFQQDGASPHFALPVGEYFDETFLGKTPNHAFDIYNKYLNRR